MSAAQREAVAAVVYGLLAIAATTDLMAALFTLVAIVSLILMRRAGDRLAHLGESDQ